MMKGPFHYGMGLRGVHYQTFGGADSVCWLCFPCFLLFIARICSPVSVCRPLCISSPPPYFHAVSFLTSYRKNGRLSSFHSAVAGNPRVVIEVALTAVIFSCSDKSTDDSHFPCCPSYLALILGNSSNTQVITLMHNIQYVWCKAVIKTVCSCSGVNIIVHTLLTSLNFRNSPSQKINIIGCARLLFALSIHNDNDSCVEYVRCKCARDHPYLGQVHPNCAVNLTT